MPNSEPDWVAVATGSAAGILGRLVVWANTQPLILSWRLVLKFLWQVPSGVALGLIGMGIADHYSLYGAQAYGVCIAVAIAGPEFIAGLVQRFLRDK